jgi:hypothetical protein
MIGESTAKGTMVSSRYNATLGRACPAESEKNRVPDNAIATRASPALDAAWTPAKRSNARRGLRGGRDRSGRSVVLVRAAPFLRGTIAAGYDDV